MIYTKIQLPSNLCHFTLQYKISDQMRLKIYENLRTVSLNPKFTGSYMEFSIQPTSVFFQYCS